jgi:hypothetical protein
MCHHEFAGCTEGDNYVSLGIGVGGGDYIEFKFCLECGQIQGEWPVEDPEWAQGKEDKSEERDEQNS